MMGVHRAVFGGKASRLSARSLWNKSVPRVYMDHLKSLQLQKASPSPLSSCNHPVKVVDGAEEADGRRNQSAKGNHTPDAQRSHSVDSLR